METHGRTIVIPDNSYFGGTRDKLRQLADSGVRGKNILLLNIRISVLLLDITKMWEEKREMTVPEILSFSPNKFEFVMKDLVDKLAVAIVVGLGLQKKDDEKIIADVVAGRIKVKGEGGVEIDPAEVS
jgi:hypothetical protein